MGSLNKASPTMERTELEAPVQINLSTLVFTKEARKITALDLKSSMCCFRIKCVAKIGTPGTSVLV